jgi:transcriptional regulator with XRE-family HTH domain
MLPKQLKAWRENNGLSQQQVADRVGKSRRTVINWELGRFAIPADIETLLKEPVQLETPEFLCFAVAELRPDLKLYGQKVGKGHERGPDHPALVLESHLCSLYMRDEKWLWSVLESEDYQFALKIDRIRRQRIEKGRAERAAQGEL